MRAEFNWLARHVDTIAWLPEEPNQRTKQKY